MTTAKTEITLIGALAKALPEIGAVAKNKANPAFKVGGKVSKYADLTAIIDALEPIRAHGLWYRQIAHPNDDGISLETIYIHEGGEELSAGQIFMPASKRDAQSFGSALTYCRRYGLQTAFGLATEDDDGNAASHRREVEPATPGMIHPDDVTKIMNLMDANNLPVGLMLGDYDPPLRALTDLPACDVDGAYEWINTEIAKRMKR
jgi:hypothetical protein